ncbi:MAG: sulfate ABC transporter substrate-binding protein [Planctomycetota bacterium]|nr:MAG: sulfate ABC transporter substrate-binding protein [Planctomycetota bacterium]
MLTGSRAAPRLPLSSAIALAACGLSILAAAGCSGAKREGGSDAQTTAIELLNVSYDPTRELYRSINEAFADDYQKKHGTVVSIKQSHAASGSQSRAVIDGLEADVVTLATWPDVEAIAKSGLIQPDWQARFDNQSVPYHSVVVFVVRKGNPKRIADWSDLDRDGISIITPNPKTSGNGKYSFLAAWGSVLASGGSTDDARGFVQRLYRRTPVLDTGARAATATFSQKGIGDVHLTFENEAHLEVEESKGELEIIYPARSIRVDPPVAVVDTNVDRKATRHAAEAYLGFLYSVDGKEIIRRHHYRPWFADQQGPPEGFPAIEMFDVEFVAGSWNDAMKNLFGEGGEFDRIYQPAGN